MQNEIENLIFQSQLIRFICIMDSDNATYPEVTCPFRDKSVEIFYIYVCGIGITSVIGIILNGLNLAVLSRQNGPVSFVMLKVLAASDIIFLLICILHFVARHLQFFSVFGDEVFRRKDKEIFPLWYWYTLPPYFMSLQNRNWIIVLITLERLVNIYQPFWAKIHVTKSRILKILSVNAVLSIGTHVCQFFDRVTEPMGYACAREGEMVYRKLQWGLDHDRYAYVILTVAVPVFSLYIMNTILICLLQKAFKKRSEMTRGTEETTTQNQANVMVIAMVVVFAVCETPAALDRVARLAGWTLSAQDPLVHYGRRIGLVLIVFNSSVNFLAYVVSTRRFRQGLVELCGCQRGLNRGDHASTDSCLTNISTISNTPDIMKMSPVKTVAEKTKN